MLQKFDLKAQQAENHLSEAYRLLTELSADLLKEYPEDKRSYQMGRVMESISGASDLASHASNIMHGIEWPVP